MSGIFGILHRDSRQVKQTSLNRMAEALIRRGPDSKSVWCKEEIGLGNRFLWATPESVGENKLATFGAGRWVVTADARIDNREELCSQLSIPQYQHSSIRDSRLILVAFAKWGESCPQHIIGDFAFAIWDNQQHVLFCARDHFGVKPFYYHSSDHLFAFASGVNALRAVTQIPDRLNKARIADYLVDSLTGLEGIDKICTLYEDIIRLEPAHSLTVSRHTIVRKKYWQPDLEKEIRLQSENEYDEAFLDIFSEAVHCRLRSSTTPASMLSGGMDSSAIVAIAQKLLPHHQQLQTYSAVSPDGTNCMETKHIKLVLKSGNIQSHHFVASDINKYYSIFEDLQKYIDEPFDTWMIIPQLMYIAAHENGLKVLMDGIPGDEVVSLPPSYIAWLLRSRKMKAAASEINGFAKFWDYPKWRIATSHTWLAYGPQFIKNVCNRINNNRNLNKILAGSMINRDFAKSINLVERLEGLEQQNQECIENITQQHVDVLNHPWLTVGLERYDRVASALGVEPRHPFMDKRLVEFCLALPWSEKVQSGWNKYILRRSMKSTLPDKVRWRTGRDHLAGAFNMVILENNKDFINNFMENTLQEMGEFIDIEAVKNKFQKCKDCDRHTSEELWDIISLGIWMDHNTN